jgi:hypothetical protein
MSDDKTHQHDPQGLKRLNYYYGQFLQQQDFADEQSYHIQQRQALGRALYTYGVLEGLTVEAVGDDAVVQVAPGSAIDGSGQLIILSAAYPVPIQTAAGSQQILAIAYAEETSDLASEKDGMAGNTRVSETPSFRLIDAGKWEAEAAAKPEHLIPLARLAWDATGKKLAGAPDMTVRVNAGVRLPSSDSGRDAALLRVSEQDGLSLLTKAGGQNAAAERLAVTNEGIVRIGALGDSTARLDVNGSLKVSEMVTLTKGLTIDDGGQLAVNGASDLRGILTVRPTLKAEKNNDVLTGMRIAPTFQNNKKTGVKQYGLIVAGGNVGIGTEQPEQTLDVRGSLQVEVPEGVGDALQVKGATNLSGELRVGGRTTLTSNLRIGVTIELLGSASGSPDGDASVIVFDGKPVEFVPKRGLNTVILSPAGERRYTENHDVWQSNTEWNTWADWVQAKAADGDIVAVVSYDLVSKVPSSGSAQTLLAGISASSFQKISGAPGDTIHLDTVAIPYALVFCKGVSAKAREALGAYRGPSVRILTSYQQVSYGSDPLHSVHVGSESYFGGNVGIGTTMPMSALSIVGGLAIGAVYAKANAAPTNGLIVEGNIGVGTTNPNGALHVAQGALEPQSSATDGALPYGSEKADLVLTRRHGSQTLNGYPASLIDLRTTNGSQQWSIAQILGVVDLNVPSGNAGGLAFLTTAPNGTANPSSTNKSDERNIGQAPATRMVIDANGNVGVGTISPRGALHVEVKPPVSGRIKSSGRTITGNNTHFQSVVRVGDFLVAGEQRRMITGFTSDASLTVDTMFTPALTQDVEYKIERPALVVTSDGNVGIGTMTPQAMLEVQGSIKARHFAVQMFSARTSVKYSLTGGSSTWYVLEELMLTLKVPYGAPCIVHYKIVAYSNTDSTPTSYLAARLKIGDNEVDGARSHTQHGIELTASGMWVGTLPVANEKPIIIRVEYRTPLTSAYIDPSSDWMTGSLQVMVLGEATQA